MSIPKHIKEHIALGLSGVGRNTYTVGPGGKYSTITDAVSDLSGTTITARGSNTKAIIAAGPALIGTGTKWLSGTDDEILIVDQLIQLDDSGIWYKVRSITSDTGAVLYQSPAGSSFSTYKTGYINYKTILLLPGEYAEDQIPFEPGINLVGVDRDACILSELTSPGAAPLDALGENFFANFTIGPTETWGAVDSIASNDLFTNLWVGAELTFQNMRFRVGNYNGDHSGGAGNWPMLSGGITRYHGCDWSIASGMRANQSAHTGNVDETRVIFSGNSFRRRSSHDSSTIRVFGNSLLQIPQNTTVDIISSAFLWRDVSIAPNGNDLACILLGDALLGAATNSVCNVIGSTLELDDSTNTVHGVLNNTSGATANLSNTTIRASGTNSHGVEGAGGDVNLHGCDIEAASAGVECSNASSTVSLRGGNRIKGTTNSLLQSAGTLNKSSTDYTVGTEGGTITASDT